MKNSLFTLMLFITFSACKKDDIPSEDKPITVEELSNYYIAGELQYQQDPPILFCIRFEKTGTTIHAFNSYKNSESQTPAIKIDSNRITLDFSGGYSESVHKFTLKREKGELAITAASFIGIFPHTVLYSTIAKKSEASAFAGKTFRQSDNEQSYLKFTADGKWDWSATGNFTQFKQTYQNIGDPVIGWKGENHLSVMLPFWKSTNGPLMVVENPDRKIVVFKVQQ